MNTPPQAPPTYQHRPVMLHESIEGLAIQPQGTYVDLTFGGGGHTRAILQHLGPQGRLFAFDQDPDSAAQATHLQDPRLTFIHANFRFLTQFLAHHHITHVHGILADLGISSYQLDNAHRGFANRIDGPLDMRMNPHLPHTAATLLQTYTQAQLTHLLRHYGEIHNPQRLAQHITRARRIQPITTTTHLKTIAAASAPPKYPNKYYAQVFQAFRIAVNDELQALQAMLLQTIPLLHTHGRLVILSYHALEDKLVKNLIKTGNLQGQPHHDPYGNLLRPLAPHHRKALQPTAQEIQHNNRARSARLRIAIKQPPHPT